MTEIDATFIPSLSHSQRTSFHDLLVGVSTVTASSISFSLSINVNLQQNKQLVVYWQSFYNLVI